MSELTAGARADKESCQRARKRQRNKKGAKRTEAADDDDEEGEGCEREHVLAPFQLEARNRDGRLGRVEHKRISKRAADYAAPDTGIGSVVHDNRTAEYWELVA